MNSLILLMAGSGSRMNMSVNKVLLPLGDKKIYEYSLDLFSKFDFEIICVISKRDKIEFPDYCKVVYGGATRMESVYNGLKASTGDYVFIHDGARPFLSSEVLKKLIDNATPSKALLTTCEIKDTVRLIKGDKLECLDRSMLVGAQTPQCAPREVLFDAYKKGIEEGLSFTDDISLIEKYYPDFKIELIEGNSDNFKITNQTDYELAKLIWRKYA